MYDDSLLEPALATTTATSSDGFAGSTSSTGGATNASATNTSGGGTPNGGNTSSATSGGGSSGTSTGGSAGTNGGSGGEGTTTTDVTSAGGSGAVGGNAGTSGSGGTGGCGMPDCCPDDDDKLDPGQCGCGMPDTDTDNDGTADCNDGCDNDPDKLDPGQCGCGIPELDGSAGVGCVPLIEGLVHRYSFAGSGSEALDSVGVADGEVIGTSLDDSGSVVLEPDVEQYVDLPDGLISTLSNATIEVWFNWDGGTMWRRLFDFGNTEEGVDGEPGTGDTFVMFTPAGPDYPYAAFNPGGGGSEVACAGISAVTSGQAHQLALSLDAEDDIFTIYLDGMLVCATAFPGELSQLQDVNSWIGRSQFESDSTFSGSVDEFRIYDFALNGDQVAFSADAGPDPAFLE